MQPSEEAMKDALAHYQANELPEHVARVIDTHLHKLCGDAVALGRWGLEWREGNKHVCKRLPDGYWTPWHLAQAALSAMPDPLAMVRAALEAAAKALEADAKLCDCAALENAECACGAWDGYKSIQVQRAIEIVRAIDPATIATVGDDVAAGRVEFRFG